MNVFDQRNVGGVSNRLELMNMSFSFIGMGKNGSVSPLVLRVRKRCKRDESWMELKISAKLVNKVPDSEKYGEFP
ncbi:hypothetical protein F2Q69_00009764 [Brassica cretica]|uniref:Uncharacterized protein n=1 Tax=Brassica cretica TaxID=69181 RepID=A0A8S9NWU6_BRACR|nr:hypothetical protein F2Q69_00009764 [Brassica cretica]